MATNSLLKVEGTAWAVSNDIENKISAFTSSNEIMTALGLDYTISAHELKTDIDEPVPDFWAMYRDDTNALLGPVKASNPIITQNVDSFNSLENMMTSGTISPVVADSYEGGRSVFGCFKLNEEFSIFDDTFNYYFIAINDHLKPDGNILIINTPVRMACMNTLSYALSRSTLRTKIPASVPAENVEIISDTLMNAYNHTSKELEKSANRMASMKVSRQNIEKILDELFPYYETTEDENKHERANQTVTLQREAFMECMKADNISNYNGTMYQVFNALTDYCTHYFKNANKGFDLTSRMTLLPGFDPTVTTESLKVSKFLNNINKFAEAA